MFDRLYEVSETAQVSFIGYASETARYDFGIIYTQSFFGKPMVVCMQTGKSALLCEQDVSNLDYLQKIYSIPTKKEAEELSLFLHQRLPALAMKEQY